MLNRRHHPPLVRCLLLTTMLLVLMRTAVRLNPLNSKILLMLLVTEADEITRRVEHNIMFSLVLGFVVWPCKGSLKCDRELPNFRVESTTIEEFRKKVFEAVSSHIIGHIKTDAVGGKKEVEPADVEADDAEAVLNNFYGIYTLARSSLFQ
eukprot:TRINITY_DN15344_c0_g1_i3.p1 TRINITY_DN15344_c0_g1~~TRINITY_DN15344_c0_g1_i3.p1  ORF type:complete len:151 (+),score=21.82 TRINITY_DN15344_c0_g1_i3:186-638(+)